MPKKIQAERRTAARERFQADGRTRKCLRGSASSKHILRRQDEKAEAPAALKGTPTVADVDAAKARVACAVTIDSGFGDSEVQEERAFQASDVRGSRRCRV